MCPDCSAPEGHPCRWIAMDGQGDLGKPRHWPHETRWRK
ncbi:zinc finger domain-containing protein [Mycobacteroides abscessus]